ncbi:hypothetical protein [Aquimarina algicola]|uniref:Uncharacterized protein n=1 Tax=Aquimarina algicola TaxID=2589995 RepID=A0A504IUJ6_9FLAO|nr:hypothetical protein [Aquimarina algicola]TPN82167.1 hypothetical protein FHK87_22340 [Aquimarina algicola]
MNKKLLTIVLAITLITSCQDNQKQNNNEYQDNPESSDESVSNDRIDNNNITKAKIDLDLEKAVNNFITCKKAATERNECRNSITEVIAETYELTEFNDPKLGYVVYDSIRLIVEQSRHWLQLGTISQKTIDQALEHTNRGGLALVIDTSKTYGHVVMIVPGETKKSGSWGMSLPYVLSLSNYKPEKSFSNKQLSYAFQKSDALKIYVRQ